MKTECIDAVAQAIGRKLTSQEVQGIEDRISRHLRQQGRDDPKAALATPMTQRLAEAAQRGAQELIHEAALKKRRVELAAIAHAKNIQFLDEAPDVVAAAGDMLGFDARARTRVQSVEIRARAIASDALRQLTTTWEASGPKFFGLFESKQGVRDIVRELHGTDTGNQAAAKGARDYHDIADSMRQQFNAFGADVRALKTWGMTHHHDARLVARAGRKEWLKSLAAGERAKAMVKDTPPPPEWAQPHWVADVLPKLDRSQYVNPDGTLLNDAQMADWLREAWTTIATGGANKIEPGQFRGNGMRANRGAEARQIHFKDGDAYFDYHASYSGRPLYEILTGHIQQMARNIALVERFGPNPDHEFRFLLDHIQKTGTLAAPAAAGKVHSDVQRLTNLYEYIAGRPVPVASQRVAAGFELTRNMLTAAYLGSSYLTSFGDNFTMQITRHVNRLPAVKMFLNQMATLNPLNRAEKRLALRAGLGWDAYVSTLNRFGTEIAGDKYSRKFASGVLRMSGLIAVTEARKRAFAVTMMDALGSLTRTVKRLGDLNPGDYRILLSKGITDTDWEVWRRATPDDWNGHHWWMRENKTTVLTPDSIYRIPDADLADLGDPATVKRDAVIRVLGAVDEETNMAVVEPGAKDRALMKGKRQRGAWFGELGQSVLLFKSFPIAMFHRHILRALSMPTVQGKLAYGAALVAGSMLCGMVSVQMDALVKGRDPRDMTDLGLWLAAMLKGGALGMYGDFLFQDTTRYGSTPFESLAGPVLGTGADLQRIGEEAFYQSAGIKNENLGADVSRFITSRMPGQNIWYLRAAFNHMIFHRLQEYYSPGYLRRSQQRARKVYGQRFWWQPGKAAPSRLPSAAAAVGGKP